MSSTSFSTSHALTVKVWAKKAFSDAVKATLYGQLRGKSDRAIVQVKDELKRSEGDRVRFNIRALPTGRGVQDGETLEGTEESLAYQYFDLNLGEKRKAFQVELNLSERRTMRNVREDMKSAKQEWLEDYLDVTFFEYLSGDYVTIDPATGIANLGTGATASYYHPTAPLGGNAVQAPSANRIVYPGTATSKATIAATDTMTFGVLDKLAERAKLASPTMRKAQFNGKSCWVVILHPYQVTSLRANTGNLQWGDIVKSQIAGGGENLFAGEVLGMYRDMLLIESVRTHVYNDYGSGSNVKAARALFLGAQAAVVATSKDTDEDGVLKTVEKEKDYGKYLGSGDTLIWAMAKTRFSNQSDFGVFAVDTAAAPV